MKGPSNHLHAMSGYSGVNNATADSTNIMSRSRTTDIRFLPLPIRVKIWEISKLTIKDDRSVVSSEKGIKHRIHRR
uniref:Ovule protein n=1 Tax=Heterorhabditis bacteriophora TaxID=37862 RepID=A0A1I7XQB8_HETBA